MLTWDEPKRKLNIKNHGLDVVVKNSADDSPRDHLAHRSDRAKPAKRTQSLPMQ